MIRGLERLYDRLDRPFDPLLRPAGILLSHAAQSPRAAAIVLIVIWSLLWWVGLMLARNGSGLHVDEAEAFAWGRALDWGYPKHPPLVGWTVGLWFRLFPPAEWAFHLLSAVNLGVTFTLVAILTRREAGIDKRLTGLAIFALLPLATILALRFNANSVLLPWWALTTLLFLRSFRTRGTAVSLAAGIAAGICMLGKYFSGLLVLGLIIAALADRRRWRYLASPAPWLATLAGLAVIGPHLLWLQGQPLAPLDYAASGHPLEDPALLALADYVAALAAYAAAPLIGFWLIVRPRAADWRAILCPADEEARLRTILLLAPLILAALIPLVMGKEPGSLWTMPAWSLLPAVLLSAPRHALPGRAAAASLVVFMLVPTLYLLLAPLAALSSAGRADAALALAAVREAWSQSAEGPLTYLGGEADLAYRLSFAAGGDVTAFPELDPHLAPWIDASAVSAAGIAILCRIEATDCLASAGAQGTGRSGVVRREIMLTQRAFGRIRQAEPVIVTIVPPAAAPEARAASPAGPAIR